MVADFPEDRKEATPRQIEDILYAGVAPPGQQRSVESIARRKAMMHALAHGAELRCHEAT
jgi:hypothetical protein